MKILITMALGLLFCIAPYAQGMGGFSGAVQSATTASASGSAQAVVASDTKQVQEERMGVVVGGKRKRVEGADEPTQRAPAFGNPPPSGAPTRVRGPVENTVISAADLKKFLDEGNDPNAYYYEDVSKQLGATSLHHLVQGAELWEKDELAACGKILAAHGARLDYTLTYQDLHAGSTPSKILYNVPGMIKHRMDWYKSTMQAINQMIMTRQRVPGDNPLVRLHNNQVQTHQQASADLWRSIELLAQLRQALIDGSAEHRKAVMSSIGFLQHIAPLVALVVAYDDANDTCKEYYEMLEKEEGTQEPLGVVSITIEEDYE